LEFSGIFAGNLNPGQYNNKENKYHLFPDDNKGGIKQAKSLETYNQFTQTVTGLIPDSGIVENPSSKDGFILCGDAAGLCNPITGAGIFNAIYSAKLASESIAKSLSLNDLNILQGIKEIYNSQFGNSINLALRKKLMQKDNWPKPLPDLTTWQSFNYKDTVKFSDLIRQTWIAFRDYWH
jgi:Dehydrogenases (flavoproteins)